MANFISYVDDSLKDLKDTKSLYLFKQKLIAEMTARSNELISQGIKDDNVITDLIKSEYPDLKKMYYDTLEQKKTKQKKAAMSKTAVLGILGYILVIVFAYLGISFKTAAWSKSWIIVVFGALIPIALAMVGVAVKNKGGKKALAVASRISLAVAIMLIAVLVFLTLFIIGGVEKSWLVFVAVLPFILVADAIYSLVTEQKLAFVTYLIYIPICAALLYVVLGLSGAISWHPGWMIIVAALIADIVIAMLKIAKGKNKEEQVWKEN